MGALLEVFRSELRERRKKRNECFDKAVEKAKKEIIPKAIKAVEECNKKAIDEFYDDYEPHFYKRTYSMYNMLEIKKDGDEVSWDFNEGNLVGERIGSDYLYPRVFQYGFHGGANGGGYPIAYVQTEDGAHFFIKKYDGNPQPFANPSIDWVYKHSEQASISPRDRFKELVKEKEAELNKELQELVNKYYEDFKKKEGV